MYILSNSDQTEDMNNPLLNFFSLPNFTAIRPKHMVPAIKATIDNCRYTIEKVIVQSSNFNWNNLCQPIAEAENNLNRVLSPIRHLNAVNNSHDIRKVYKQILSLISEYNVWVRQNKKLYQAYLDLRYGQYYEHLSIAQKKAINNILRDFKLYGIELPGFKQNRFSKILSRLSELEIIYSNNVFDATMNWSKLIDDKQLLAGMPDSAIASAHAKAHAKKLNGWLLTLDLPSYLLVITYCDNAELRKEIYQAYNTRASDLGQNGNKWDNTPIIEEILALRHELAQLLGFNNYAEKSLSTKMLQKPQHVLYFLTNLINRVRTKGKTEFAQLLNFVQQYFNLDRIDPWDFIYYSEKQKRHLFSINDEQLRQYFPENQVIKGLFEIVKRIFCINIKERNDVETWHQDVRFFDIFDENNELRGSFYLDLYIRNTKCSGAWMDEYVGMMRKTNGEIQKPVAYITCNFSRPINGEPALFNHNEVITLFHEFGHALHHILTKIDIFGVSGISGVPWDAIEIPSQFMEKYCWQYESLSFVSCHYKTGNFMPKIMLNNLLKMKHYQSALFILRQLEFCLFDFIIHYNYNPEIKSFIFDTWSEIKKQVAILPTAQWERFFHTFNHIFTDDYAAGYYSYLWADVLASDIWLRFEEEGILNLDTGKLFLNTILSRGGSEDPICLFNRFRGRDPQLNAMLRHYGIL